MKVLIGVDSHKASVATAVIDEASGDLLERASFPQNSAGLGSLERWARRFPERRPKRWRTPVASVATWREGVLRGSRARIDRLSCEVASVGFRVVVNTNPNPRRLFRTTN